MKRPKRALASTPQQVRYGRKGQQWHPDFITYIGSVVQDGTYSGMPDLYGDDSKIQWEAPSNRKSGKFRYTYNKRLAWWRKKALAVGIDPRSSQWISRTAKLVHPTRSKPCKRCGKVMEIRYAYPNKQLLERIKRLPYVSQDFPLDPLEHITSLITRLIEQYGERVFSDLPKLLSTASAKPPILPNTLKAWLEWVEQQFIPSEPRLLSPGAMSNAPDRLDGFHSFNLCCRSRADTGRHPTNLQSYSTDRRVFEYWADGDWIAADRLMGQIRANLADSPCRNQHSGPCSADHIGPISLGFTHRPEFQLLCKSCNSAKNNRMSLEDVVRLREVKSSGQQVVSWHTKPLWDLLKHLVTDNETALRLSKILRDYRHTLMCIFQRIAEQGNFTFLTSLLNLSYADYDVEFTHLRVERYTTAFDQEIRRPRKTKYAIEQKARRCRVALEALLFYFDKPNRNAFVVWSPEIESRIHAALAHLKRSDRTVKEIDQNLAHLVSPAGSRSNEEGFKKMVSRLPATAVQTFVAARRELEAAMALIAKELASRWKDERYTRVDLEEFESAL